MTCDTWTRSLRALILVAGMFLPSVFAGDASSDPDATFDFNFDRVEVAAFAKIVGEMTGRRFAVDEAIKGRVTIVSPKVIRRDVYPLFVSVLESVGCTVVEDGGVARIVPLSPRGSTAAPVVGVAETMPSQGVVTKIFRLEHVSAAQARRALESRVSGGKSGAVVDVEETNHLLVTDTVESIRRIEQIVAELDRPGLLRTTDVVALKHANAENLSVQLNQALAEKQTRAGQLLSRLPASPDTPARDRVGASIVAVPDSNSLLLVGTPSQIQELKRIVSAMDTDTAAGRGSLNAIFLKYIRAEEAGKSIDAVLNRMAKSPATSSARSITIEASPANNALLVHATPGDFEDVRRLVDQLDQERQQVHIEVLIAEVSAGDSLNIGVDMVALNAPARVGSTTVSGGSLITDKADALMSAVQNGILPGGLTVGVAHGGRLDSSGRVISSFPAILSLDAIRKNSKFKVLSETALEAQNNREASVSIVNQYPILKSTIQGGTGASRDVIQNIERVDVGIKLKLTPYVIPGGLVQMVLNPSIEAVVDAGSAGTQFTPVIARREVSTTVTVPDGQTIIIAGLTREDKREVVKRVPILGYIPLIGMLFRHTAESVERTNLLIFVTPRVVGDRAASDKVLQEWQRRTGLSPHETR